MNGGVKRLAKDILYAHRYRLSVLLVMTLIAFTSIAVSHWLFGRAISEMMKDINDTGATLESNLLWWFTVIITYAIFRGFFL